MEIELSYVDPGLPKSTFFHIGQVEKTCKNSYRSTVKRHYPAYAITKQERQSSRPNQSFILPVETRVKKFETLTSTSYLKNSVERLPLSNVAKLGLGTKNLVKMNHDDTSTPFETTHQAFFPTRVLEKVVGNKDGMKTSIVQGDLEKMRIPISDYKQSYEMRKVGVTLPAQFKPSSLLQGDTRSYENQYETTTKKSFGGKHITPCKLQAIKNNGCSILHGDPSKCTCTVTTNQQFFKEKPLKKVESCGPSNESSVVLGDDRGNWSLSKYNKDLPIPRAEAQHAFVERMKEIMAKSSGSQGDMDPERVLKRITQTTSACAFKEPIVQSPYAKVNGANLLTKSNVKFDIENVVPLNHYNTTTKSYFSDKPELVVQKRKAPKSSVSFNYFNGGVKSNQPTTVIDFFPHKGPRQDAPNPECFAKLKNSHIQFPKTENTKFITSHTVSFPAKTSKRETYEAGKFHYKSSIRFGNISLHL